MCAACATSRPSASKSAVEQSRRSLMLAEKAPRTSTTPISSAIPHEGAAEHRSATSRVSLRALPRAAPARPRRRPRARPGGTSRRVTARRIAAAHGLTAAAGRVRAPARPHSLPARLDAICEDQSLSERCPDGVTQSGGASSRPARPSPSSPGGSSPGPGARACRPRRARTPSRSVAVAPLVGPWNAAATSRRAAPRARTTGRGSAGRPRRSGAARARRPRAAGVRRRRVAALVGDGEPERRQDAARARHEHLRIPSSSASAQACSGPGAAEGDQREVTRVDAALDRDEPERARHLGVGDVDDGAAGRSRRAPGRPRRSVEHDARREAVRGSRPRSEVRVGHRRLRAAAAVARRARLGAGALAGRRGARRPRRPGRSSRRRRRRCGCRRSAGAIGSPPTTLSVERSARPPTIGATSVEVPPMSRESTSGKPASRARGRRRPPRRPGRRGRRRRRARPPPRGREPARRAHHERRGQPGLGERSPSARR